MSNLVVVHLVKNYHPSMKIELSLQFSKIVQSEFILIHILIQSIGTILLYIKFNITIPCTPRSHKWLLHSAIPVFFQALGMEIQRSSKVCCASIDYVPVAVW